VAKRQKIKIIFRVLLFQRINSKLPHFTKNPEFRLLILILSSYFFISYPLAQIYLKDNFFLQNYWALFFFAFTLIVLFFFGRLSFSQLGLSSPSKRCICLGLIAGICPVITVIALDLLLLKTGLAESDLFSGAELRESPNLTIISLLLDGVLNPVMSQIFITGYALNILAKRNDLAISFNGILYSIMSFNLGIGYLVIGIVSAALLRFSGSIIPAIFFAIGCSAANFLILIFYPRIITLLVLLV
jgi:hypothetical protein